MDEFEEEGFDFLEIPDIDDPPEVVEITDAENDEDEDIWNIEGDISICNEDGQSYKVGERWKRQGVCELRICNRGGIISVVPCPSFIYDKEKVESGECLIKEENNNREYPMCCEIIYCALTEEERKTIMGFNDEPK